MSSKTIKGIKYISLRGGIGYAVAAKRYIIGLIHSGIPVTWTPMTYCPSDKSKFKLFTGDKIGERGLDSLCNKNIAYDTVIIHTWPELYPMVIEKEPGKKLIGYTVWETDKLQDHWPQLLNMTTRVIVPCHWNKQVFEACGVTAPVSVVPHIMENKTTSDAELSWNIKASDFVFYTINRWTDRKAIESLLHSYLNTFSEHDRTLLVIKTTKRSSSGLFYTRIDWIRKTANRIKQYIKIPKVVDKMNDTDFLVQKILKRYRNPARILLITDEISEDEIFKLHQHGDCYVSLTRSEGWGLGAFDAASLNKPVIMTGFGGQMDFLPEDLAYLVNYKLIPNKYANGKYADPDMNHASRLMRQVYENKEEALQKGMMLGKHIRENFNEKKIIKKLLDSISG